MARHNETGRWGEDLACDRFVEEGYAILERNWRCGRYEVDIIAMKDDSLVFAEVKTRSDIEDDPLDAMTSHKIRCLVRAANAFIQQNSLPHQPRFDIVAVSGTREDYKLTHIADAFFPPLKTY